MFALFSGLYESYLVPEPLTILMVGLDNSGKTVLLESMKQSFNSTSVLMRADQIKPTIGVNCAKISIRGTAVSIYDAAGSLRSRPLWNHYYGDCDGNIFVLDSAGIERQEEMALVYGAVVAAVNNAQKRGKKKGGKGYAARKGSIPIGVFSNKEDLAGEKGGTIMTPDDLEDILPFDSRVTSKYFLCSGLDSLTSGRNSPSTTAIRNAVEWIVDTAKTNRR